MPYCCSRSGAKRDICRGPTARLRRECAGMTHLPTGTDPHGRLGSHASGAQSSTRKGDKRGAAGAKYKAAGMNTWRTPLGTSTAHKAIVGRSQWHIYELVVSGLLVRLLPERGCVSIRTPVCQTSELRAVEATGSSRQQANHSGMPGWAFIT